MLTKNMLKNLFDKARENQLPYVVIGLQTPTGTEAVIVPAASFDAKEKFYMDVYTDDLTHVMNKEVRIFKIITVESSEFIHLVFDGEVLGVPLVVKKPLIDERLVLRANLEEAGLGDYIRELELRLKANGDDLPISREDVQDLLFLDL